MLAVALGIVGLFTLIIGAMRAFGSDGCHSGLHGIPILELTESIYPFFSFSLLAVSMGIIIREDRKKKKCQQDDGANDPQRG